MVTCTFVVVFMTTVVLPTGFGTANEPASVSREKRSRPRSIDSWVTPLISTQHGIGNISIPENHIGNTTIFIETSPEAVSYVIASQDISGKFDVYSDSGLLFVNAEPEIDYDKGMRLTTIVIEAEAPDESTATATLSVWITDANDEAPTFSDSLYAVVVRESTPAGGSVIRLTANDMDENPAFRSVILSITEGDTGGLFTIYDDGSINVAEKQNLYNSTAYFLTVKASDGVNDGFTNVIVGVCSNKLIQNGSDVIFSNTALLVLVLCCIISL